MNTHIKINAVSLSPSWYQKWTREPVMGLLGNTWIKQSFLKETALILRYLEDYLEEESSMN